MRYAIFTDIHANLEALEAVLAKIDELAQEEPIDQIWFLGDLVGYGPNPNECIVKLRDRTDIIIAGNHDWAAVGKIDLEDFSAAARISAEWTAEQLTEEHRTFLIELPERREIGDCTLVHGSPYGPLWEYLTSEVLAERSFQHFSSRYCFVGHTHVPIIFQQPDTIATTPTIPLDLSEMQTQEDQESESKEDRDDNNDEVPEMVAISPTTQTMQAASAVESPHTAPDTPQDTLTDIDETTQENQPEETNEEATNQAAPSEEVEDTQEVEETEDTEKAEEAEDSITSQEEEATETPESPPSTTLEEESDGEDDTPPVEQKSDITPEESILDAEDRLNQEIEELLGLLGLSQSLINVTNEMVTPPEGEWQTSPNYRAIVNPGGVGQPRDGDPRAAFMIYDTARGFTFYRVSYSFEKTQEKIVKAGLPQYLATRLAHGR